MIHIHTSRPIARVAVLAIALLVAAGCGSDSGDSTPTTQAADAPDAMATGSNDDAQGDAMTKDPGPADAGDAAMDKADSMANGDSEATGEPMEKKRTSPGDLTSPRQVTVTARSSQFGTILFDGNGQVFYLFDADDRNRSNCYGECAKAWPPVLVEGMPEAGSGARDGLLGTTRRRNGATQLTYNGHPLYYYAHERPGQVLCHNVHDNGGLWLVVTPAGRAARA